MNDVSRERAVIQLLEQDGHMTVAGLSQNLFISESTTRRMLKKLEREGVVHCHHGHVMLAADGLPKSILLRSESMSREKRSIAAAAATLIRDNTVIFLDTSTTVKHTIEFLRRKSGVTVVTNSLPALALLQAYAIPAKCTGGDLENESSGFVGYRAHKYISGICADLFLFSTPCIDTRGRVSDYSEQETYVRQEMMKNARRTAFLFDHSKYDKDGSFTVCSLKDVDYLVSDMDLTSAFSREDGTPIPLYLVEHRNGSVCLAATKPALAGPRRNHR